MKALARYRRVMLGAELWLWPWWLTVSRTGETDGPSDVAIHIGPLTLRARWDFREGGG